MAPVECQQVVADWVPRPVRQGVQIADCKTCHRMCRIQGLLQYRVQAASVIFQLAGVLRMDRVLFPFHIFRIEQGRHELLSKTIQRRFQIIGIHIKEIVGVVRRSEGIVAATVLVDERLIFAGLRILLRSQKQHVLKKMCQPLAPRRIILTAHRHIHGCRGLFSLRVGNQQYLKAVVQRQRTVGTLIVGACNDLTISGHRAPVVEHGA